MDESLDIKLGQEFPNLYPSFRPLYPKGPHNSHFQFECGDGWFVLLHDLSKEIEPEMLRIKLVYLVEQLINPEERDFEFVPQIQQVKEKFGTLRFYLTRATDRIDQAIRRAETRSAETCESCGKPGKMRGGGWMSVTCGEHARDKPPVA